MMRNKKLLVGVVILVLFSVYIVSNGYKIWKNGDINKESENSESSSLETTSSSDVETVRSENYERLLKNQSKLELKYGKVPEGFLWDTDGTLLSVGDKSMTAEESMYAYLQGVASLDFGTAQRYSRGSAVVETYSDFFNSKGGGSTDYKDQFIRNMYKECLLSLQITSVLNTSVFAENKTVFTVKGKILDLTDKDFWKKDEMEIFKNLYVYNLEDDTAKSEIYLYDYILDYYRSDKALLRDTTFDITCERFSDVDSGWLVSIDSDLDDACRYKDGNLVVSYIKSEYRERGRGIMKESEKEAELNTETQVPDDGNEVLETSSKKKTRTSDIPDEEFYTDNTVVMEDFDNIGESEDSFNKFWEEHLD